MQRFCQLYTRLDETNRTASKLAALEAYFREAPPADAVWALFFLCGKRVPAPVKLPCLRRWAADLTGLPLWLVDECTDHVGDLAESLALLLPEDVERRPGGAAELPLHRFVEERVLALRDWDEPLQFPIVRQTWAELPGRSRFLYNKLLTGAFRVGVSRTLVSKALAAVAGVEPAGMAHRLMASWRPSPETWRSLVEPPRDAANKRDPAQPYPFFLAAQLDGPSATDPSQKLGPLQDWQVEWKWDGIRAQLLRRAGQVVLWSRGEEVLTERFPELARAAARLPEGTVLDGEILAWRDDKPIPFAALQRRITRKNLSAAITRTVPVRFVAYDCLEHAGADIRALPLQERRGLLEKLVTALPAGEPLGLSGLLHACDWPDLARLRTSSRERGVEGLMLKRLRSPYQSGRPLGDWWKWKIDPYTVDAVLVYAQPGHGRRAGLLSDYTFAVWQGAELVPVAKAYSGLSDSELREVDAWIHRHTLDKRGPVRVVEPTLVFELAFEAIAASGRHRSGLAVRFPRIARWRRDKTPPDADTLERLRALLPPDWTAAPE